MNRPEYMERRSWTLFLLQLCARRFEPTRRLLQRDLAEYRRTYYRTPAEAAADRDDGHLLDRTEA